MEEKKNNLKNTSTKNSKKKNNNSKNSNSKNNSKSNNHKYKKNSNNQKNNSKKKETLENEKVEKVNYQENFEQPIKPKKKKLKMKLGCKIFIFLFFLLILGSCLYFFKDDLLKLKEPKTIKEEPIDYQSYFHESVKLNEDKKLYEYLDGKFIESGLIKKDLVLDLENTDTIDKGYFKLKDFDYYIDYKDLEENVLEEEDNKNQKMETYKNYIPYNESVKTNEVTNFYQNDILQFTINKEMTFPIIIREDNYYGVIYQDKLYYLKKDEVTTFANNNTDLKHTNGIATLVYHYVYDSSNQEEKNKCKSWNVTICLSDEQFRGHMNYLKDNNFYTATMEDISLFIDNKIQLPEKTVLLTIDDGAFTKASTKILEELNMHATLFLVGIVGEPANYESPSIEIHSHSYDLHKTGVCPGGQGGGIKCLARDVILEDLRKSREQLNGSTVFCYPFFEYNDYAISLLKEAGFEMAFAGGRTKIKVGSDKYKLPRYGVINTTYVSDIAKIVN